MLYIHIYIYLTYIFVFKHKLCVYCCYLDEFLASGLARIGSAARGLGSESPSSPGASGENDFEMPLI